MEDTVLLHWESLKGYNPKRILGVHPWVTVAERQSHKKFAHASNNIGNIWVSKADFELLLGPFLNLTFGAKLAPRLSEDDLSAAQQASGAL